MKKFELSIPKPCHENWDAMTPAEQGRFCGACQKTVIDFSNMADRDIAQFFKKPVGGMCGRFHPDQLDRTIEMPTKRIPWLKYFFTISLPAFLFSLKASAQREIVGKVAITKENKWIDSTLSPLPTVKNKPPLKGRISVKKPVRLTIEEIKFKSLFIDQNIPVEPLPSIAQQPVATSLVFQRLMGAVMYSSPVRTKQKESPKQMPQKNSDTAFFNFSVFPNPVTSGASFTLQPNRMDPGTYELSIFTSAGDVIQRKQVLLEGKSKVLVTLTALASGPYFIRLTDKRDDKQYTEIIIVQ